VFSGLLRWLGGKPKQATKLIESAPHVAPLRQNQEEDLSKTSAFSFFVDEPRLQDYTKVGLSVKLWTPKENPEQVYIYHRDGPGGCLGMVPPRYSSLIAAHLVNGLEHEAVVEERTATTCKVKCRLLSKEETEQRRKEDARSLQRELAKPYVPRKPMTLKLATQIEGAVKVGDKLKIEFGSLESYLQDAKTERGPYGCQWRLAFCDQSGITVGVLAHDKAAIHRILKAHFNSYVLDVEVVETSFHIDYTEEKARSSWGGYPFSVVITAHKSSAQFHRKPGRD
jgi:hypothetical protein